MTRQANPPTLRWLILITIGGNVRAILLLSLTAAFIGCLTSREPTSSAAVPDPQIIFEALLASDAQLQESNVELTNRASTLSLLMGRESGPARLCLLGAIRMRNPIFDPIQDDPAEAWVNLEGPQSYETQLTVLWPSVSCSLDLDGRQLPITGTLSKDWETLRLTIPLLGSMRMTQTSSFPDCEEESGSDPAEP